MPAPDTGWLPYRRRWLLLALAILAWNVAGDEVSESEAILTPTAEVAGTSSRTESPEETAGASGDTAIGSVDILPKDKEQLGGYTIGEHLTELKKEDEEVIAKVLDQLIKVQEEKEEKAEVDDSGVLPKIKPNADKSVVLTLTKNGTQVVEAEVKQKAFDAPDALDLEDFSSERKEQLISTGLLVLVLIIITSWFGGQVCRRFNLQAIQVPFIATCLGLQFGFVLHMFQGMGQRTVLQRILAFNEDFFFMSILPPIILESGFSLRGMKAQQFFKNFGTILWYTLFATSISFIIVGASMYFSSQLGFIGEDDWSIREAFGFGALISSTDPVSILTMFKYLPVNPVVDCLVSGESLLNDAISIILYRTIVHTQSQSIVQPMVHCLTLFCSSVAIGFGTGIISALIHKFMRFGNDPGSSPIEFSLVLLFPWIAYLLGDGTGNSGIVSILFCAIAMAHYTTPNLSACVADTTHHVFQALSMLAETVAFVFLGLAVFSMPQSQFSIPLFLTTTIIVSSARVISIYSTSLVVNLFRHADPITPAFQTALVCSGLRGSVAFALALHARHDFGGAVGSAILSATLSYALFTILVVGPINCPLFHRLGLFLSEPQLSEMNREMNANGIVDTPMKVTFAWRLKHFVLQADEYIIQLLKPSRGSNRPSATIRHSTPNAADEKGVTAGSPATFRLHWKDGTEDATTLEAELANLETGRSV